MDRSLKFKQKIRNNYKNKNQGQMKWNTCDEVDGSYQKQTRDNPSTKTHATVVKIHERKTLFFKETTYPDNQININSELPIAKAAMKNMTETTVTRTLAHRINHVPASQSFARCFTIHILDPNARKQRGSK